MGRSGFCLFYNTNRRCALQIILHRATRDSNTTAISRELVPLAASRSICRKCLMVSLLFAGIKAPLLHREVLAGRTAYSFRASTL
jgi:hypothetical protein